MTRVFLGVVAALLLHGLVTVARLEPVRTLRGVDASVAARLATRARWTRLRAPSAFHDQHFPRCRALEVARVGDVSLARCADLGSFTLSSRAGIFALTRTDPGRDWVLGLRHSPDVLARAVAYGAPTVTLLLTALLCAWAFRTSHPREPSEPASAPLRPESPYRDAPLVDLGPEAPPAFDLLAARELRFSVLVGWGLALHALPAVTASLHLAR